MPPKIEFQPAAIVRTNRERLRLEGEICPNCNNYIFPKRAICPNCGGEKDSPPIPITHNSQLITN